MKLVRYGARGLERPGLIDAQGRIRNLAGIIPDFTGAHLGPSSLRKLLKLDPTKLPLVRGTPRLGACVSGTRHFIAVGLNYADHAKEAGLPIPSEPILFEKAPSCIVGPDDDMMLPKGSTSTDWEVELAVVIGSTARYVPKAQALESLLGSASATMFPSAHFNTIAVVNGPRERDARPSGRSVRGWSLRMRSRTFRDYRSGSTSTAREGRAAQL